MKTQKEFKCGFAGCRITFSNEQELTEHKKKAHGKRYPCLVPNCRFKGSTREGNLKEHTKKKHPDEATDFDLFYPETPDEYPISVDDYGSNLAGLSCADGQSSSPPHSGAHYPSQYRQLQIDPQMRYSLPIEPETNPSNVYAYPNAQLHGVWSNNNYQVGMLENTASSHLYTAILEEQVAITTGQSSYGYSSHSGEFTSPAKVCDNDWNAHTEEGGQSEGSEDNYGRTNYTWGA